MAGAAGITVHLREDRRHICDRDVRLLRQTVRTVLNLEMAANDDIVAIACEVRPDIATLVPEKREARTTEGGLDLMNPGALSRAITRLHEAGIEVSLFIDPTKDAVSRARDLGVRRIELHTGYYCEARGPKVAEELARLRDAAALGASLGLHVAAGHGLDYPNVGQVAAIPEVTELNIGHAIIARAVLVGLDRAVRDMIETVRRAEQGVRP